MLWVKGTILASFFVVFTCFSGALAQDAVTAATPQTSGEVIPKAVADALARDLGSLQSLYRALENEKNAGGFLVLRYSKLSEIDNYQYHMELRNHTISTLKWQQLSAYVLLVLVVIVTLLGAVLSFLEVRNSMKVPQEILKIAAKSSRKDSNKAKGDDALALAALANQNSTLEVSAQKLQLTSAITGLAILVLSLGFLYVFVDKVLELKPIDLTTEFNENLRPDAKNSPSE